MSRLITYGCLFAFALLFVLGFIITPWLSLVSFAFLLVATLYLIYQRHIKNDIAARLIKEERRKNK